MSAALWVGLGGFIGAILRFMATAFVKRLTPAAALPWGTLAVNVVGCLVMGFAVGKVEAGDRLFSAPSTRAFFLVGLLGSFTTYSTFGNETWLLFRDDSMGAALANVGLHLALGLASVRAGFAIARWI